MIQSIAERAISEIACRLKKIRKADGYKTDAGLKVLRARRTVTLDDLPCVVIWDQGESIAEGSADRIKVTLSISIDGHVGCDQDDTGHMLECLKADIKRAVLSGSSGQLADQPGKQGRIGSLAITGCAVTAREEGSKSESMTVSFEVSYPEGYGNPYGPDPENS